MTIARRAQHKMIAIGDTVLNVTYRAKPYHQDPDSLPFSYLNEEWLESVKDSPEYSIQGIGYVSNYIAGVVPELDLTLLTGIGTGTNSLRLRERLTGRVNSRSRFDLTAGDTFSVTRILRDLSSKRIRGNDPLYRPQIRMDSPSGQAVRVTEVWKQVSDIATGDTTCLFRITSPSFFSGLSETAICDELHQLQEEIHKSRARLILDIRPLPPSLRVLDPRTVVCTTIGRLREWQQLDHRLPQAGLSAVELIERAFWALSPVSALYCFAADAGTVVCARSPETGSVSINIVETQWPITDPDGCGAVVAGDAWEAALVLGLLDQVPPLEIAARASAALSIAMGQPLGKQVSDIAVRALAPKLNNRAENLKSERLERIELVEKLIRDNEPIDYVPMLAAPAGGQLREMLTALEQLLTNWRPRKGRDLIAVFGESRCGKEYIVKRILAKIGWTFVGPVNMHQFLSELRGCLNTLVGSASDPMRTALLIDEVTPGDSARSLLNLLGEKSYRSYHTNDPQIDFSNHPVLLLSSIPADTLLDDLRGRMFHGQGIIVPSLADRWHEIPFLLGPIFSSLRKEGAIPNAAVAISRQAMSALLNHDYHPRPQVSLELLDAGLDQRNFRALDDLIRWIARRTTIASSTKDHTLIKRRHLPDALAVIASARASDETYFVYSSDGKVQCDVADLNVDTARGKIKGNRSRRRD